MKLIKYEAYLLKSKGAKLEGLNKFFIWQPVANDGHYWSLWCNVYFVAFFI